MKLKTPVYRNLKSIPVYFEDTSLTSEEVFRITEFPVRLTAGKNIFKLQGNPNNLNNGSYLDIEILDYNGDPIYHEVTDVITEDNSRIISVFIYGNTPPGDAEVILVATANSLFGELVPEEWLDYPNVRWSRLIPVNPTQNNVTEIIFSQLPNITIKEQVGAQLDRSYTTTQYPTYNTGTVRYVSNNSYPILIVSNGTFNNQMVGGTVTISNPVNPTPESYYDIPTIPYSSKIKKVLSTSSILLDTEYKIASSDSIIPHIYTNFDSSTYSISYEATPTYVPTQNSESYALVEIDNLDPIAGDVSRIKVFMNNTGTIGTWELINDIELEETDVFVTGTASLEPYKSIGDITSQTVINTYYTASSYLGNTRQTAPTLVYDNTDLSNALKITSNVDLSDNTRVHILQVSSSVAGKFIKDSLYKITLDAVGTRTIASGNTNPEILIYASGSAFNYDYGDYYNQELPIQLGRQIGNLFVNNDSQRFDDSAFYFSADETGDGVLLFVIKGGEWKLSDIRTTTDNDKGFTPEYARIRSLVPTPHKSNVQFAFKIEYYNSDGAKSKQVNYTDGISWEGGNRYVDGEYSMITGSLYVADSLENGIAISGYKDTGYIRSLGYDGFNAGYPGFLLWSGSAMTGSGDNYNGVGLELYADRDNYFRYRTNPSELVVKTKSFYFGSSSQYISGSNGSIAISSSNFYLAPNGSVTLSGSNVTLQTPNFFLGNGSNYISGSGGNIMISGSNVMMRTPNFFFGSGSTFISGSGGNLQIKSNNFSVSANGAVTASNIYLEDVAIADSFVYNTITVNDSNYTQYYTNYSITDLLLTGSVSGYSTRQFTKLVLDGSNGGQSGKQVRLERLPDYPIGMVLPGGYSPGSSRGYDITIENWALSTTGNFSAVLFASAVASGSSTFKGNTDFGFFADMWDQSAASYQSYPASHLNLKSLTSPNIIYYGEGAIGLKQTYKTSATTALSSQVLPLYYGNQFTFQRTVASSLPSGFGLLDKYFQLVGTDCNLTLNPYFPSGMKTGGGILMGGPGSHNPFSRGSDIHGSPAPDPLAVLELRADTNSTNQPDGIHTIFIPPKLSTSDFDAVYTLSLPFNPSPPTPPAGAIYYNTTTNKLMVYNGTVWQACN